MALADALDSYIPEPKRAWTVAFLMPIEDVFSISGLGTVGDGARRARDREVGDEIEIVGIRPTVKTTCTGWRCSASCSIRGRLGTTWGAAEGHQARGRGARTGAGQAGVDHAAHEVRVRGVRALEGRGGRHTPFFNNYRPQFYFRTTDVTGSVVLPEGTEMVMPGDNVKMVVTLIAPIAMEQGLRFAIREGGRTVGAGVVAKVLE